jgi:hypothetical protein
MKQRLLGSTSEEKGIQDDQRVERRLIKGTKKRGALTSRERMRLEYRQAIRGPGWGRFSSFE